MIVVVGAGMTGLALGHHLHGRGEPVRIFEAAAEAGGVIRSREVDGAVLDLGPQRTRLTPGVAALVDAAGLRDQIVAASPDLPLFVYRDGRLRRVPFSPWQAVRTDLLSLPAKLRALLEPLTSPPRPRETVEDYLVRSFGREAYRNLLGPLYGGLYASDPGRMPARHALAMALEEMDVGHSLLLAFLRRGRAARRRIAAVSFRDGLGALPRALARELGDAVRMSAPVRRLVPGPSGRLQVETEGEGPVEARAVVLTCPAAEAGRILADAAPDASRALRSLTYNPLAVVHLRSDFSRDGLGYQVAFGETLETRGVTWNASLFDRDGVFTAYLGGMKHPEIVEEDDDRLAEIAAREFREATGARAEPLLVSRTRVPGWDRSWDALDGLALPDGVRLCGAYTGRPGIPGRIVEARRTAEALAR